MDLYGLQKMTLLDFPGLVACTVFLGGCDFRCPFCHNFELVTGEAPKAMDEDAFFAFLDKRHGLLDGVAVTGGEPCLYRDLPDFLARIRDKGFAVKLDTNGNHPAVLKEVLDRGLADYVAMDVKNSPDRYALTVGLDSFDTSKVNESIGMLLAGGADYEFRTTAVDELHDETSFEGIGRWIRGAKRYYIQSFTDRDTVPYEGFHAPSAEKLVRYRDIISRYVGEVKIRGVDNL